MNEIETILCTLKRCDRSRLFLDRRATILSAREAKRLEDVLKGRMGGAPLQVALGTTEFFGLSFKVNQHVLIPRPETEVLVDKVIAYLLKSGLTACRILDIGTGSGNIAITLAKFSKVSRTQVEAIDISSKALDVARANARAHRVGRRVRFSVADMNTYFEKGAGPFDVIVSNPPYVRPDEFEALPEEVRQEPREALVAVDRGLACYKTIERGARASLKAGGIIFLEIGADQAGDLKQIFNDRSFWTDVTVQKDLADRDRVFIARRAIHG
jgi:release factor glutamine methyltransferase